MPAIKLKNCKNECPERCVNDGKWKYRNHNKWPVKDKHKCIQLRSGRYHSKFSYKTNKMMFFIFQI